MNLGAPELLIILLIVMLLFGAARLPKLAKSLGQASKEFKEGIKTGATDASDAKDGPTSASSGDKPSA